MPEVVTVVGIALTYVPGLQILGWALIVIGAVWGSEEMKRKQKEAEEEARRQYNASLKDRNATVVRSDSPFVYVYGRARVGSSVVAMLTNGNKDQYKHLVCIHAAHECDAIEEVYIGGVALGALDGSGNVTGGQYYSEQNVDTQEYFSGTGTTLAHTPNGGSLRLFYNDGDGNQAEEILYTLVGNVISGAPARSYTVNYTYKVGTPYVRVLKHLVGDVVDSVTQGEFGDAWPATATLTGFCYTIIRLDLNYRDFQSGLPTIEALVRGKKLHDVRDPAYPNDTPVWSQNPALVIADYLTSEMCAVPYTDLPLSDYVTAANVCDENITTPVAIGARYLCNGTVSADQSQAQVLENLAQCMAGTISATTWRITAGKYVAPIMALTQADIVGDMSYTAGTPEADLYNGVKGQYISAENLYVVTDFQPYQNATYLAEDGEEYWTDYSFMFTDTKQRVHNLCRIFTEDQRNAFAIEASFSYKCWALQVGDRISFTSELLGQIDKVYRITKKVFSADAAVMITMKEDVPEIWDFLDAVTTDATPNTNIPSPFIVAPPGNLTAYDSLYETTGSAGVKVQLNVDWDAPNDVTVIDYELQWKQYGASDWSHSAIIQNSYYVIPDVSSGQYDLKVRARNSLGIYSEFTAVKTVNVYGLATPPSNVLNFTIINFNGAAIARWTRTIDLDVKIGGDVEIRFCPLTVGATWEQSYVIPDGKMNGDASSAIIPLATGTYFAKFIDSTGNYSLTPASFVATESLVTGWSTVFTSTQSPSFAGVKTNVIAIDGILKLTSAGMFDSIVDLDAEDFIDSIGGISTSGTYEFDSILDMTTVATRRFHSHIAALSYNANDSFDNRLTNFDAWDDFDGGRINDTSAVCYASISNDGVTYADWVPFMVADFSCRYAKFKLALGTVDTSHNINISELEVKVKVPV